MGDEGNPNDSSLESLVDRVCIDLIERRRMGQQVRAEDYVEQMPQLARDDLLLDLIDAEICVAAELQQVIDPNELVNRFPSMAKAIMELVGLDSSASFSGELVVATEQPQGESFPLVAGHPLHAPEWFLAEKCLASGSGRWLIRGRDTLRGIAVAMKVLELPPQLRNLPAEPLLDACEAASMVRHPIWVAPTVAAIQHGHLGVILPWVFAVPWIDVASKRDVASQLREFASIAYCLEAAHRAGASHGSVHAGNLLIDHDGKLRLVDAVANQEGLRRWSSLSATSPPGGSSDWVQQRRQTDLEDLIQLVASAASLWHQPWTDRLLDDLRAIGSASFTAQPSEGQRRGAQPQGVQPQAESTEGAAAAIGAKLLEFADTPPIGSNRRSQTGQKRWKRWFGGR